MIRLTSKRACKRKRLRLDSLDDILRMTRFREIPIYNAASLKRFTYDSLKTEVQMLVSNFPAAHQFGLPSVTFTRCSYYAELIRLFRCIIPALIVDGILVLTKNKPR